jgi:putative NIF3 family GTP cyclohydrolase 1 type 2
MNRSKGDRQANDFDRRKFIETGLKLTAAAVLPTIPFANAFTMNRDYTVQDVIDLILKEIPVAPLNQTVDTIKAGMGDQKVSGIITTMFATVEVIRKAASFNANFIIAHEPTFYNHTDDINWTGNNEVVKQKQELLKQHGLTVWRFHDYWHAYRPDGIAYGVLKKANWLQYNKNAQKTFMLPATPLKQIAEHLKKSLHIDQLRIIGDLCFLIQKISLLPGAWGGQNQISTTEKERPDLVVVGEVHEWEMAEYIRDARLLGSKTSLIILGHSVSEEPGMEWLAEWLQPKLKGIQVRHIPSNNPFTWF